MSFRLIKGSEIREKSHSSYLQEYSTWADGIAQTLGAKIKKEEKLILRKTRCFIRRLHKIMN